MHVLARAHIGYLQSSSTREESRVETQNLTLVRALLQRGMEIHHFCRTNTNRGFKNIKCASRFSHLLENDAFRLARYEKLTIKLSLNGLPNLRLRTIAVKSSII